MSYLTLAFIFDAVTESLIGFVSFLIVAAVENFSSTKNRSYRKRGCVNMRNCMGMFHDNIGNNLHKNF